MNTVRCSSNLLFVLLSITLLLTLNGCEPPKNQSLSPVPSRPALAAMSYTLVRTLPHDSSAFTEGLFIHKGELYESTGATPQLPQTRSLFGIVNAKTGNITVKAELNKAAYFGEGIALLNDKIYQLTYKNQKVLVYNASTFKRIAEYHYDNAEGWGLTTDGKVLIMSDGTSALTLRDPTDFHVVKTINVAENGNERDHINELEYVDGFVYANIWTTSNIVKIDLATGNVVARLDCSALEADANSRSRDCAEMNGIAYDPATKHFFLTGKMWPTMYELDISQ